MRTRITSLLLGLSLALAVAAPVAADVIPGNADLGLDSVAISSTAVDTRAGTATVSGTIECSQDVEGTVWVAARQTVGRFFTIQGDSGMEFSCLAADGSVDFTFEVQPYEGKFGGGKATVAAFAEAVICEGEEEETECLFDSASSGPLAIRFRPGR